MGATYRRTDLHEKCGSCAHAQPHPTAPGCILCRNRPLAGGNAVISRSAKRCSNYRFDPTKLCRCGETKEPWYKFCPTCGVALKEGTNHG